MSIPPDFSLRVSSDNGSVPSDLQNALILTLDARGDGTVEERIGEERGAPTPIRVDPAALAALYADLVALGLFSTAWAAPDGPLTPGGPSVWVRATGDGAEARIPPMVEDAQREAQGALIRRVEAAVTRSLRL